MAEKLKMHSPDLVMSNIEKIAELFPNCVTEAAGGNGKITRKIDFDLLRQELSDEVIDGPNERYHLNWPGKREAMLVANAPIAKTLRPCREESVDFDKTKNLFIEGDNLEALKLLQETYLGKVKMIYIDPPYNTGSDLIYRDDFSISTSDYLQRSLQVTSNGDKLSTNEESNGRFHSDWLSMFMSRLVLAKRLLRDDGLLFVSVDDNEIDNCRKICDERFGEDNFIGIFVVNSTPNARDYGHIGKMHEYVLFYARNAEYTKTNLIPVKDKSFAYKDSVGPFNIHPLYNSNVAFHSGNRPNLYYPFYLDPTTRVDGDFYSICLENRSGYIEVYPPLSQREQVQFVWRWGREKALGNLNSEIVGYKTGSGEYRIVQKMRHSEKLIRSLLTESAFSTRRGTAEVENLFGKKVFSFPKPLELIKLLCRVGLDEHDLVLDLFAGSCTLPHAIIELNAEDNGCRRYLAIQYPEKTGQETVANKSGFDNVSAIGKERIKLASSQLKAKPSLIQPEIDLGFRVLKVDSSNMRDVYYSPENTTQELLEALVDNIKPDRTGEDLLFQVLLDCGVDLGLPIKSENVEGCEVFFVNDSEHAPPDLVACFDQDVPELLIQTIAAKSPLRAVFRDQCFATDAGKINVEQVFKQLSPNTQLKSL